MVTTSIIDRHHTMQAFVLMTQACISKALTAIFTILSVVIQAAKFEHEVHVCLLHAAGRKLVRLLSIFVGVVLRFPSPPLRWASWPASRILQQDVIETRQSQSRCCVLF